MVVVFAEVLALVFSGVEEEFSGEHFEGHAGERPHIGAEIVLRPCEHFGAAVLPCLDFCGEVVVLPAGIAQVCDLYLEAVLQLGTLVEDELCPEGREKFLYVFLLAGLFGLGLGTCGVGFLLFFLFLWFFGELADFILEFFEFSFEVFLLVFVEVLSFESLLDF